MQKGRASAGMPDLRQWSRDAVTGSTELATRLRQVGEFVEHIMIELIPKMLKSAR